MAKRPLHEYDREANTRWALHQAVSEMARWCIAWVDLPKATGMEDALWEPFQLDYLNACTLDGRTSIAMSKSRQIGASFLIGLEGVARSECSAGSLTNIVSFNQDEAEEKIRYANQIIEAVWSDAQRPNVRSKQGEIAFFNGSRIRSHACRPPRGRPGANHRLDEVAHYQKPQVIYNAAVPGIARKGSIACMSSPWVRGGFHYNLMEHPEEYPDYTRMWIPWWACFGFCNHVAEAAVKAPTMVTEERVSKYGTDRLKFLYRNMPLDAFQVEFELQYADDSLSWITWEEIVACTGQADFPYIIANGMDQVQAVLPQLLAQPRIGPVFAGYDVARKHDKAVIALLQLVSGTLMCFAVLVLDNVRFEDQKTLLKQISPIVQSGCIDATGLGANLAENMHDHDFKWAEVTMSAPAKATLAVDLRQQFQDETIIIPPDRDLQRDIHSVRRTVTAANNIVFDAERDSELGHADRFWALALAVNATVRQWYSSGVSVAEMTKQATEQRVTAVDGTTGEEKQIVVRHRTADDVNADLLAGQQGGSAKSGGVDPALRAEMERLHPWLKNK